MAPKLPAIETSTPLLHLLKIWGQLDVTYALRVLYPWGVKKSLIGRGCHLGILFLDKTIFTFYLILFFSDCQKSKCLETKNYLFFKKNLFGLYDKKYFSGGGNLSTLLRICLHIISIIHLPKLPTVAVVPQADV